MTDPMWTHARFEVAGKAGIRDDRMFMGEKRHISPVGCARDAQTMPECHAP